VIVKAANAILRGLFAESASLISDSVDLIIDVVKAFPDLARMTDLIARYVTGLLGRLLAIPWSGYGEVFGDAVQELYGSRLMTPRDCVRLVFRIPTEILQAITFTDESGILQVIVTWLARGLYRLVKRFKLIAALLRVKSEEQFVALILKTLKGKGRKVFWVVLIIGILAFETLLAGYVFVWGMTLIVFNGNMSEYLLAQDSKRMWKKRSSQARVNRRPGEDQ